MSTPQPTASTDWVDLQQAERDYPYSRRTFWKLISSGQLAAYRPIGKKVLLRRSEIDALFSASPVGKDLDQLADEAVQAVLGNG